MQQGGGVATAAVGDGDHTGRAGGPSRVSARWCR
jgi:hypothetical protein